MFAIKKFVKITKKKVYRVILRDSDVKFDINLIKDSEEYNTYVITFSELEGKIKPKHLDANYMYKTVTTRLLLKLHQRNLVLMFDRQGRALAVNKTLSGEP
jgi:uncharacterized beta-barrel protein YwiB (DUF1934 family)